MIVWAGELFTGHEPHDGGFRGSADGSAGAGGWVETHGDRIVAVGRGRPPRPADVELPDARLAPGFVDIHVHGGGGGSFTSAADAEIEAAVRLHRSHGTTTMLASLVAASPETLRAQIAALARWTDAGELAGIHLEGPWLSPSHCGAHDPSLLTPPDRALADALLELAGGAIRMVTIAPELSGFAEAARALRDAGTIIAIGHTGCDYDQARAAIDAGATIATHLFNAMPPMHHRAPGPALALLEDPRVGVELIFDGIHLHPAVAAAALSSVGSRGILITDAMSAAGSPDGRYRLGGLDVDVREGIARLTGAETIAGSTLTLDRAVRNAIAAGIAPAAAIAAATSRPSTHLGLDDVGLLETGRRADLVVLDRAWRPTRVMRGGAWLETPEAPADRS